MSAQQVVEQINVASIKEAESKVRGLLSLKDSIKILNGDYINKK